MNIVTIKKTQSTNDYVLKYLKKGEDVAVISEVQTKGRGTKGRSFSSEKGGIYLSMIRYYNDLPCERAFEIIKDVSVAVVNTLIAFNVNAKIKWPNDVMVGNKKICGILTENKVENGKIVYSIIGIGLNVTNEIPLELAEIAVSMKQVIGEEASYEKTLATLLYNLGKKAEVGQYAGYSCVLGKTVQVFEGEKSYFATVKSILEDGRIEFSDGRKVSSCEIKLKLG